MNSSPIYRFNSSASAWQESIDSSPSISKPPQFTLLTFNVLFDAWWGKPYKHHVVCPEERFEHQFEVLKTMNVDIIALNEVTPHYLSKIIVQKWVQESYYISDIDGTTINNFGNLVLSKFPIAAINLAQLSHLSRPVVCVKIPFEEQHLIVASTHLSAQKENIARRQIQIKELCQVLKETYPNEDKIIAGDLNYHVEKEIIPKGYLDAWKAVHPNQPGYTFDGTINRMLHEISPLGWMYGFKDDVQMRLDRICVQSINWQATAIEICLNNPVYDAKQKTNFFKDVLSTLFDRFRINVARNPKHYLFPSDHFGLVSTFKTTKNRHED